MHFILVTCFAVGEDNDFWCKFTPICYNYCCKKSQVLPSFAHLEINILAVDTDTLLGMFTDPVSYVGYRFESPGEVISSCSWSSNPRFPAHLCIGEKVSLALKDCFLSLD